MRACILAGVAAAVRCALVVTAVIACGSPDTEVPSPSPLPPRRACADVPAAAPDADLPTIPVGLDAYRRWEEWPTLRLGTRTYMRSTYDRSGKNFDSSNFLRKTGSEYVTLDVTGPGVLSFVRANHWHGSPWRYVVDGQETVVTDTATADPDHPPASSTFLPPDLFPEPLALTWATTAGADVSWVPIPFSSSLELRYGRTHYGTGYYIYSSYPEGATNLSQTPCTWEKTPPPDDVRALLRSTAEDLAPSLGTDRASGVLDVMPGVTTRVVRLEGGPRTLRAIGFDVAEQDAAAFGRATLRITWDDRALPSVEVPVALFFGTGSADATVRAFPVAVRHAGSRARFTTIFPMPFARSATLEVIGADAFAHGVAYEVRSEPSLAPPGWKGYFHATHHDTPTPTPGRDVGLLDTTRDEGGGDWCGTLVGTSFTFSDRAVLTTLEGDPRFFFDDSGTPQAQGTGTEEWGGGGDYWEGGRLTTLPLAGHPTIGSAYRFLLGDAMPFGKNARVQIEHGGEDESTEHYDGVTFWYGLPGGCLVLSDALHVGDAADERAHGWTLAGTSEPAVLTSRYEVGVDHDANGVEVVPETTDTGATMVGRVTFRMAIPPDNAGVILRRKLDYGIADQRAVVSIADDADDAPFVRAGVWYLAGSNSVVFASPPTETGTDPGVIATSNRRWRDDELLVARALTAGRSRIRVRIDVVRPSQGWSAFRYWAYAWRLPPAP